MPKVNKSAVRSADPTSAVSIAQLRSVAAERVGTVIMTVPAGASKLHAAETLAQEIGGTVVRVDLGQLMSRFIGETEKNLDRVFSSAAASGAVLFFDEADALFGKRSDVKDSHDRYANVDVDHLLQRIETHGGIVVLASGGREHLDPAFLKRLRRVVYLPWPPKGA